MSFINNYIHPDLTLLYAEEFYEESVPFIYAVGHTEQGPVIVKARKNGSTVWQQAMQAGVGKASFYKIVQLSSKKGLQYVLTSYNGTELYVLSVKPDGTPSWCRLIHTRDADLHCFLEPVVGRPEFYIAYSDKNDDDTLRYPIVLKFNEGGNVIDQVILKTSLKHTGFVINSVKSRERGLVLGGRLILEDSVAFLLDLSHDFKKCGMQLIREPHLTVQDIVVNEEGDYLISAYSNPDDAVIVSHITTKLSADYVAFSGTTNHASVLTKGEKFLYLSVFTKFSGTVHALSPGLSIQWSKKLLLNEQQETGIKTLEYHRDSDSITATTRNESLLVHTDDQLDTCITKRLDAPKLREGKLTIAREKVAIVPGRTDVTKVNPDRMSLKAQVQPICGEEEECERDERLCNFHKELREKYESCFAQLTLPSLKDEVTCAKRMISMLHAFNTEFPFYNIDTNLEEEIETVKDFLQQPSQNTYNAANQAMQSIIDYLYERGNCGCGKEDGGPEISETVMLQSPHLYLQSVGSTGVDSTKGIHLRWTFKDGLFKHLPKADYATPGIGFNKADDYVRIYRARYQEYKIAIDLRTAPGLVYDPTGHWMYTSGTLGFDVYFRNLEKYADVRSAIDPMTNPHDFILAYGNELIEIEQKTQLAFAVTLHFPVPAGGNTAIELLSVEKNTILSPKRASFRKKYPTAQLSGKKLFSENIRSVRFRASAAIGPIEFEFYGNFISKTAREGGWQFLGKHALTTNTTTAFERLEPTPNAVHGKWLRYNDGAYANMENYRYRWNAAALDPENRIQDTVERYIELSDVAGNPEAIEMVYYNDPAADPIPGYEPDPDFDPSENQFALSNLMVLQLASLDYHTARMLGLGVLDLAPEIMTGQYMYLAEYVSVGDLEDGLGAREVQHFFCTLPTGLSDQRLPIPIDLKTPVPGIFQGLGTEAPTPLTNADGYSVDGRSRYISLFHENLPEETDNAEFFDQFREFISAESTVPVYAGIEYRKTGDADWQKPELPFDRSYFNIDPTVAADQRNETRAVVLPDPGYPVFVHREKKSGWHDYSSYGINWFSRATRSTVVHTIETQIVPENLLQPPTNTNAVLIRKENPLLLTSAGEQAAYAAISSTDKTFIRLTFDYNHGQELIDYHKAIDGELVSGYSELPDSEELFAERIEVFFRNSVPNSVSGNVLSVINDSNPLLAIVSTDPFPLSSEGPGAFINPEIAAGLEPNFIGSALTIDGAVFIVHQVDNSGTYPRFTVFKNDPDGRPVALTSTLTSGELTAPTAGKLFIAIENMLSPASWNTPNPLAFDVRTEWNTVHRETITVRLPDGSNETHVQKFRGIYENAVVTKVLEDHDGNMATTPVHLGLYRILFFNPLAQHPQAGGTGHRTEWHKGVVRVHTIGQPNGPRKELQVVRTENIGTSQPLIVYAVDNTFDPDPSYDQVATGTAAVKVNYYPGFKVYLTHDAVHRLDATSILPGPDEDLRYSIFGLRSRDTHLGYVSKISPPVLMFAQKIEEPMTPRTPVGGLYATRPDFFGKASYTFTTQFDHRPYSVQFGRASDIQILTALWRNDEPSDPSIWTVKKIQDELFERGEAEWYAERWQNLLGFNYTYASAHSTNGHFERLPDAADGKVLPLPNNPAFITAINAFIAAHNAEYSTSVPTITTIDSLHRQIIPPGPFNGELRVVDFVRDVVHNCFVPMTEIPVIYQHIHTQAAYEPQPKKQVIRDERGELLKPEDPRFDMAPMMKVIATNQTQFTDFNIDGASNAKYFYISREFNLQMQAGPYSSVLGPVNLVNTVPPRAPEIVKIVPILENRLAGTGAAVELQLNAYAAHQKIRRITIYRATSLQDALSIRTMKAVKVVDLTTPTSGEIWSVRDDFSDLGYVPYGDPLFYVLTVSRELKYNDRNGDPVTEYQPSEPSKTTVTNIVEVYNPEAPTLSSDFTVVAGDLQSVELSWDKTVYNGKYHLYKRNEKGSWIKIGQVQSNADLLTLPLADTDLGSGTLAKTNAEGKTIYHVFKVVAENFAGMMSREEKILSI